MTLAFPRCLLALTLVLTHAGTCVAKTAYTHATVGNADVVSSMSQERTTRFLHELIGIRLLIEDLLATPARQASTQIVVFGSQQEMDEFYPKETIGTAIFNKKWVCSTAPEGDTFSIINEWPNDRHFREEALQAHASFLISRSLPNCPYWIYQGLSQLLCTLEYHDGKIRIGTTAFERDNVKPAKRATLVETLAKPWGSRDISGLWRMWLTEDYDGNRVKIRRLADLIRHGAPGNATTVSEAFGQPIAEIQAALYKHMRRITDATVDRPALTQHLFTGVEFKPATEFELAVARGMILATVVNLPSTIESGLQALAMQHPDSPRPWEALARLATVNRNPEAADAYWLKALALQTQNTYAHLVALRQPLEPRSNQINLQPSLTRERTVELRQINDRAMALDPGLFEALSWSAWIEALAQQPEPTRIDAVVASHTRYLKPTTFIPLAVANLRLGRLDEASRLLDEYQRLLGPNGKNQAAADFLRARITAARKQ